MLDRDSLKKRIIKYLREKGFKPTGYTEHLAYAIAYAVVDEIQANAVVSGSSSAGPVKGTVS